VAITLAQAASGCAVTYSITNQWPGGFRANVSLTNLGDPVANWTLTWSFGGSQQVTQAWNATVTQSGSKVTARDVSYNGSRPRAPARGSVQRVVERRQSCADRFRDERCRPHRWDDDVSDADSHPDARVRGTSVDPALDRSGFLMSAKPASGHSIVSVTDPSIVRYNGQWLAYATTADASGAWSVEYTDFGDFSQAASGPQYYLSDNPNIGGRYMAAPQLFYFAPKNKWFLVFQQGPSAFSTTDDPTKPQTSSTPTNFFAADPPVVTRRGKGWLDFFVICDTANCYLFSADDAGDIFRSQTTLANFPNGFGNTIVLLHGDNAGNVLEGTAVYKVKESNTYLMLVDGFDANGHRIYRAWTSGSLSGSWTPYPTSSTSPFAAAANTTFPAGQRTNDISHGELIRTDTTRTSRLTPATCSFSTRAPIRPVPGCRTRRFRRSWACSPRPTPAAREAMFPVVSTSRPAAFRIIDSPTDRH
jgi:Glycosyl hydrolase family 62/Cellulose binding domain